MQRYLERLAQQRATSYAAQYQVDASLDDLFEVARLKDRHAELAEVSELRVLVVRYQSVGDNQPPITEYEIVEAGSWLVYSQSFDLLYDSDPETFEEEHELANGGTHD